MQEVRKALMMGKLTQLPNWTMVALLLSNMLVMLRLDIIKPSFYYFEGIKENLHTHKKY